MRHIDFLPFFQVVGKLLLSSFRHILEEYRRVSDDGDIGARLMRILRQIASESGLAPPFVSDEEIEFGHLSPSALFQSLLLLLFVPEREGRRSDFDVFRPRVAML